MQPTVSQLTLTSSYQPQFSYTSNTHVHRFPFRPTDRPTDRPLCSYRHKFLHNYLDAAATHLQPKSKSQPPPPPFLPSFFLRALSLSLTIAKTDPLASTKNSFSQNRRNLSKTQPTQECLSPLLSYTVTQREENSAPRSPSGTSEFIGSPAWEQFMSDLLFLQLQQL